jgi:dihydrofolate reductase
MYSGLHCQPSRLREALRRAKPATIQFSNHPFDAIPPSKSRMFNGRKSQFLKVCLYCKNTRRKTPPLMPKEMRKLKLQVQMSVDGYIAGPNGEMDWMAWNWDDKLKDYASELSDSIGTILLGRKMAGGFMSHWSGVAQWPENPEYSFAKKMMDTPKIVFSKTLARSEWTNTVLAKGDYVEEINKLKKEKGKDIIVYGGAAFDSSLIKAGLIDEYHLFINPAVIGNGLPIFRGVDIKRNLRLVKSIGFECGIVLLNYEPKR